MATPLLNLSELSAQTGGAEVTYNDTLRILEALIVGNAINETRTSDPASPSAGDTYIIQSFGSTSGNWSAFANDDIVIYTGTGWVAVTPSQGLRLWNQSTATLRVFHSTSWTNA